MINEKLLGGVFISSTCTCRHIIYYFAKCVMVEIICSYNSYLRCVSTKDTMLAVICRNKSIKSVLVGWVKLIRILLCKAKIHFNIFRSTTLVLLYYQEHNSKISNSSIYLLVSYLMLINVKYSNIAGETTPNTEWAHLYVSLHSKVSQNKIYQLFSMLLTRDVSINNTMTSHYITKEEYSGIQIIIKYLYSAIFFYKINLIDNNIDMQLDEFL